MSPNRPTNWTGKLTRKRVYHKPPTVTAEVSFLRIVLDVFVVAGHQFPDTRMGRHQDGRSTQVIRRKGRRENSINNYDCLLCPLVI